MKIGGFGFADYTYVMAIINLTPDSFYPSSRATSDDVLRRVESAVNEGAAVVDIGAQSTRPGYCEISADGEIERLGDAVYGIKRNFGIPVSVDTYFEKTARAALSAGADMINDIYGFSREKGIARAVAEYGASACIMHNSDVPLQGDIFASILPFLKKQTDYALSCGVAKDRIIVDGGIGFAKDRAQNFELLANYARLNALGYPTLIGVSRKSMFGGRVEDRLPQTLAATKLAAKSGVLFVRVHDVKENVEAIKEAYGG